MKQLLEQARKRVIGHLVLDKGALALTIGMGGAVLLLLIGTQILDWYWPVLLAAVSLGVGVYQLRKFVPSVYVLAQRIDRKMNLADSLSTAVYFSENPKPGSESVCAVQFQAANQMAAGVNLEAALPLTRSRYVVPAAILFVAASGLFFTRYLMTGSLDLRASLIDMVVDNFFTSPAEELVAKAQRAAAKQRPFDPTQPNASPDEQAKMDVPPDVQKGNQLKSNDPSEANNGDEGQKGADDQQADQEQSDSSKDGAPQDKSDKQGREGDDKGKSESQGQDQRSTMDKVRDAVNNLMNKLKTDPAQKGAQKGGDKQQAKQNKGDQGKEKGEKSEGDPQSDSDQQGDQGDPKDAKQSNAPGQKASEEAKSGAGQDDGKKDILNAKELEAMGKMSELLAERSAAISGDMLVEVGSTSQQLKTAMTQQKAGHTDAGGEIHRDQVPLAYQTFVDRYFQEVRKAPAAKAGKAKAAAPKQ